MQKRGRGVIGQLINAISYIGGKIIDPGNKNAWGEKHSFQITNKGIQQASYIGPGTDIAFKIRNNVQPINE